MQIPFSLVPASSVCDFIAICEPSSGIPSAASVAGRAQDALGELGIHTGRLILNTVMALEIDLQNKVRRVCVYLLWAKERKISPSQFKSKIL